MVIQSFNLPRPGTGLPSKPAASPQPVQTFLAPGDGWIPSRPNQIATAASGTVIGASLGVYAGLAQSGLGNVAAGVVGLAGGALGGAVVGAATSYLLRQMPWGDKNEWNDLYAAKYAAVPGAIAGGIAGALLPASPASAVILGLGGAAAGATIGYLLGDN